VVYDLGNIDLPSAIVKHPMPMQIPTPQIPTQSLYKETKYYPIMSLSGLLSRPYFQVSLAAEYSQVLLRPHFVLSFALRCEIGMLSAIEDLDLYSLQTWKRTPSSSPVYFDRRSDQHPRILPRQLGDVSRTVVHLWLIEEVGVVGLNRDSVCHYAQPE